MRTTDSDVKAIISTDLNTVPFILTASLLVDTYLGTSPLSAGLLREIEKYWTAHLIRVREPQVQRTEIGDTVVQYTTGKAAIGLESTPYGQTVLDLAQGLLTQVTAATGTPIRRARMWVD